jgi:tetraacyldisaccharide 4'-kinase
VYALIIAVRNARYDRPSAAQRVAAPVISIGNLTTGGTGKTPMVIHVVQRLRALGRTPAVVARGYAAGPRGADELLLVSQAVAGTPCIANPNRVAGAREAVAQHGADVIVLDDAFQHRRIARDLDIVLLDATAPFGGGHLLPRGRLREPIASLARCHAVILTRTDQVDESQLVQLRREVTQRAPDWPVLACTHSPQSPQPLPSAGHAANPDAVAYFLMSGIANPAAFERTVQTRGLHCCGHARFPDHHRYTARDVEDVCTQAASAGADRLLVTEKDAVKLAPLIANWRMPVDVLPVRIDFCGADATMLDQLLVAMLENWKAPAAVHAAPANA